MKRLTLAATGFGCAVTLVLGAPVASATDVQCNGSLTGSVVGNVVVPRGAFCFISNATVSGNLTAQIDAGVSVSSSTIAGNYACNNCLFAELDDSTVGGNFLISGEKEGSFILDSVINGDLQIKTSDGDGLGFSIEKNSVGGNLTFNNNKGDSFITDNTITGNLQCHNNVPAPTSAGNAAKSMTGQCAP